MFFVVYFVIVQQIVMVVNSSMSRSVQCSCFPYLNTYDGRTIRYTNSLIKANDTIKLNVESNKIVDFIKFDVGNVFMVIGGRNRDRVGVIKNCEKHKGSFEVIDVQDATRHKFATRLGSPLEMV